jgi:hypothetical protein
MSLLEESMGRFSVFFFKVPNRYVTIAGVCSCSHVAHTGENPFEGLALQCVSADLVGRTVFFSFSTGGGQQGGGREEGAILFCQSGREVA